MSAKTVTGSLSESSSSGVPKLHLESRKKTSKRHVFLSKRDLRQQKDGEFLKRIETVAERVQTIEKNRRSEATFIFSSRTATSQVVDNHYNIKTRLDQFYAELGGSQESLNLLSTEVHCVTPPTSTPKSIVALFLLDQSLRVESRKVKGLKELVQHPLFTTAYRIRKGKTEEFDLILNARDKNEEKIAKLKALFKTTIKEMNLELLKLEDINDERLVGYIKDVYFKTTEYFHHKIKQLDDTADILDEITEVMEKLHTYEIYQESKEKKANEAEKTESSDLTEEGFYVVEKPKKELAQDMQFLSGRCWWGFIPIPSYFVANWGTYAHCKDEWKALETIGAEIHAFQDELQSIFLKIIEGKEVNVPFKRFDKNLSSLSAQVEEIRKKLYAMDRKKIRGVLCFSELWLELIREIKEDLAFVKDLMGEECASVLAVQKSVFKFLEQPFKAPSTLAECESGLNTLAEFVYPLAMKKWFIAPKQSYKSEFTSAFKTRMESILDLTIGEIGQRVLDQTQSSNLLSEEQLTEFLLLRKEVSSSDMPDFFRISLMKILVRRSYFFDDNSMSLFDVALFNLETHYNHLLESAKQQKIFKDIYLNHGKLSEVKSLTPDFMKGLSDLFLDLTQCLTCPGDFENIHRYTRSRFFLQVIESEEDIPNLGIENLIRLAHEKLEVIKKTEDFPALLPIKVYAVLKEKPLYPGDKEFWDVFLTDLAHALWGNDETKAPAVNRLNTFFTSDKAKRNVEIDKIRLLLVDYSFHIPEGEKISLYENDNLNVLLLRYLKDDKTAIGMQNMFGVVTCERLIMELKNEINTIGAQVRSALKTRGSGDFLWEQSLKLHDELMKLAEEEKPDAWHKGLIDQKINQLVEHAIATDISKEYKKVILACLDEVFLKIPEYFSAELMQKLIEIDPSLLKRLEKLAKKA